MGFWDSVKKLFTPKKTDTGTSLGSPVLKESETSDKSKATTTVNIPKTDIQKEAATQTSRSSGGSYSRSTYERPTNVEGELEAVEVRTTRDSSGQITSQTETVKSTRISPVRIQGQGAAYQTQNVISAVEPYQIRTEAPLSTWEATKISTRRLGGGWDVTKQQIGAGNVFSAFGAGWAYVFDPFKYTGELGGTQIAYTELKKGSISPTESPFRDVTYGELAQEEYTQAIIRGDSSYTTRYPQVTTRTGSKVTTFAPAAIETGGIIAGYAAAPATGGVSGVLASAYLVGSGFESTVKSKVIGASIGQVSFSDVNYAQAAMGVATIGAGFYGLGKTNIMIEKQLMQAELTGLGQKEFNFIEARSVEGDKALSQVIAQRQYGGLQQTLTLEGEIFKTGDRTFFYPRGEGVATTSGTFIQNYYGTPSGTKILASRAFEIGSKGSVIELGGGFSASIAKQTYIPMYSAGVVYEGSTSYSKVIGDYAKSVRAEAYAPVQDLTIGVSKQLPSENWYYSRGFSVQRIDVTTGQQGIRANILLNAESRGVTKVAYDMYKAPEFAGSLGGGTKTTFATTFQAPIVSQSLLTQAATPMSINAATSAATTVGATGAILNNIKQTGQITKQVNIQQDITLPQQRAAIIPTSSTIQMPETITRSRGAIGLSTAQIPNLSQAQIPIVTGKQTNIQKQIQRAGLITPSFVRSNININTQTNFKPPFVFIPLDMGAGLQLPSNIVRGGSSPVGYTPSLSALIFNIRGAMPKGRVETGLSFRPITPSFRFTRRFKLKNLF